MQSPYVVSAVPARCQAPRERLARPASAKVVRVDVPAQKGGARRFRPLQPGIRHARAPFPLIGRGGFGGLGTCTHRSFINITQTVSFEETRKEVASWPRVRLPVPRRQPSRPRPGRPDRANNGADKPNMVRGVALAQYAPYAMPLLLVL